MKSMIPPLEIGGMKIKEPYLVFKPGISEKEYLEMTDEDSNCELFEGDLIMGSPASTRHEEVFGFLYFLMSGYADKKGLGKVMGSRLPMRLEQGTFVEPEIIFVQKEREHLFKEQCLEGPADLVVEILSPSTYRYDLTMKREKYKSHRIREIWFVDIIKNKLLVDLLKGDSYETLEIEKGRLTSHVLEGFWIDLEWIWAKSLTNRYDVLQSILGQGSS